MKTRRIEFRPGSEGEFDEVVAWDCNIHIEMMDDKTFWMSVSKGKEEYHIVVSADSKLKIHTSDESERP